MFEFQSFFKQFERDAFKSEKYSNGINYLKILSRKVHANFKKIRTFNIIKNNPFIHKPEVNWKYD